MKDIKSKESILKSKYFSDQVIFNEKGIHEAMEEYAKQEAIEFLCWADGQGYECNLHTDDGEKMWLAYNSKYCNTEELYELYLKQK